MLTCVLTDCLAEVAGARIQNALEFPTTGEELATSSKLMTSQNSSAVNEHTQQIIYRNRHQRVLGKIADPRGIGTEITG